MGKKASDRHFRITSRRSSNGLKSFHQKTGQIKEMFCVIRIKRQILMSMRITDSDHRPSIRSKDDGDAFRAISEIGFR
jgi:hypothetical protein